MIRTLDEFPQVVGWRKKVSDLNDYGVAYVQDLGNGVYKHVYFHTRSKNEYDSVTEVRAYLQVISEHVCVSSTYWRGGSKPESFVKAFVAATEGLEFRVRHLVDLIRRSGCA